jgi:hypothetical protein
LTRSRVQPLRVRLWNGRGILNHRLSLMFGGLDLFT